VKFNFIELIRSAFVKRDQKFRQRLTVFLICLLISIFVWFTVKMDNEYQEIIPIHLKYINPPKSQVLVDVSDSVIFVELNEKGSELLRYRYLDNREPLEVSTKNVVLTQRAGYATSYILTSTLFDELGYQQDLAGRVVSISPDTIYLSFKKVSAKRVPVTANLQVNTEKQYMVYGKIQFQPDSILIRGPEDILENISEASIGTLDYKGLNETTSLMLPVINDSQFEYIQTFPNQVRVVIPIEKFTETTIDIPVTVLADTSIRIRLFPDMVKLNCLVALKDYRQVSPGMFMVVADFRAVDMEKEKEIRLKLTEAPSTIKVTRIEPEKAEFIIIK
jgi:YbbR domain-containing protein